MKNVVIRSLTGLVYIGAIVGAIFAGPGLFSILLALFMIPSFFELSHMTEGSADGDRSTLILDILIGELVLLFGMIPDTSVSVLVPAAMVLLLIRFALQLYRPALKPVGALAHSALSLVYIAAPLSLLGWIYTLNPAIVLGIFVMIWLNDTGAFCVGSLIGRNKLFERVSPKKSWEGFFGGLIFSIAAGALYYYCFSESFAINEVSMSLGTLMGLGAVVGIAGTFGDLCESVFKRSCGVKDSGKLLPGHGGMLDRIDSLLFVAPATAAYLMLFCC